MKKKSDYQVYKNLLIRNLCLMKRCFGDESKVPEEAFVGLAEKESIELNDKIRVRAVLLIL